MKIKLNLYSGQGTSAAISFIVSPAQINSLVHYLNPRCFFLIPIVIFHYQLSFLMVFANSIINVTIEFTII